MLSPSPAVRIFLALEAVDMRGGHNALSGVVRRLGLDPLDGHLYVFLNGRRFMAALLWYDGSGWCVMKKRLSQGTFQALEAQPGARQLRIDSATLAALLHGVELRAPRRRWYRRGGPAGP
jgi:transposase